MESKRNRNAGGGSPRVWRIASVALLAAALACGAVACAKKAKQGEAEDVYDRLSGQTSMVPLDGTEEPTAGPTEGPEETAEPADIWTQLGVSQPEKTVDFGNLEETVNSDIYAWIYIPDTKVDYPVLQHPTDNLYYLNHNLDGSSGYPGCIYSENYNSKWFDDPVTVLYGHNMKNGSMFAGLHKYSDIEYMRAHPYIYIYIGEKTLVYRIFAAHEYSNNHILYKRDYTDSSVMEAYLKEIKEGGAIGDVIDDEVEVGGASRILTLSTCISSKPNNRFLVQGVLLNAE